MSHIKSETELGTQTGAEEIVPLLEDTITVSKQEQVSGRVRVSVVTDELQEVVRQALQGELLSVERVSLDQLLAAGSISSIRTEGDVTIIPILEEQLVGS